MKHFFLITNKAKDPDGIYTGRITEYLRAHGAKASCTIFGRMAEHTQVPDEAECVIVLGGDGTLLKAARDMIEYEIPLLGVNLGTLGYLAEVEIGSVEKALDMLLEEKYTKEYRMMLDGRVFHNEKFESSFQTIYGSSIASMACDMQGCKREVNNFALNDIVISRCGSLQILQFDIYVNGRFLNGYSADGIIVATPTGSTGYNMSAGGPIAEPGANLILLTPICPHTLNTRSIILSPEDEVTIVIPEGKENAVQTVEANFDGTHKVTLTTGDKVVIKKASKTTGILKLNTESFLEILHKKMNGS